MNRKNDRRLAAILSGQERDARGLNRQPHERVLERVLAPVPSAREQAKRRRRGFYS